MLGTLRLSLYKGKFFTVAGGPYHDKPDGTIGVKMAREIDKPCDISIPTKDFSEPPVALARKGLCEAVDHILAGERLYIGCMGGKGRTGLFMALLAKAFGEADPVMFVRKEYYAHAVETTTQYDYVDDFEIPTSIKRKIRWARVKAFFRKPGNLTT